MFMNKICECVTGNVIGKDIRIRECKFPAIQLVTDRLSILPAEEDSTTSLPHCSCILSQLVRVTKDLQSLMPPSRSHTRILLGKANEKEVRLMLLSWFWSMSSFPQLNKL